MFSRNGHHDISHPIHSNYTATSILLPWSGGVYIPSPCTWTDLYDHLDQKSMVEVLLYDFWHRVIKTPYTIALFFWDIWFWKPGTMLEEADSHMKRPCIGVMPTALDEVPADSQPQPPEMRHFQMNPAIESPLAFVFPREAPGIKQGQRQVIPMYPIWIPDPQSPIE